MENTLLKIFGIIAPLSGVAFAITSILSKIVLHRNGVKVTFLYSTLKDIREMKKMSTRNIKYRSLYRSLLASSIAILIMFVLFATMIVISLYG
jgi:hypothetical protein